MTPTTAWQTADVDSRLFVPVFEVHLWPAAGRIVLVHFPAYGNPPVVTDLRATGLGQARIDSELLLLAVALAKAADPAPATVTEHGAGGRMTSIDVDSFDRTQIRPV
jgi:hypothetical protein